MKEVPKVYICSSLKPDNYLYVSELLTKLPPAIHLRPNASQLVADDRRHFVESDVAMIKYCDELWVLGRFGRDCTWEIGFATALGKTIRILRDRANDQVLQEDWMYMHGQVEGLLTVYESIHDFRKGSL